MSQYLNLQELRDYDHTLENTTFDVNTIIDNIYIGPQGELLEAVDSFNSKHGTNIGITKQFTLKPGGYDQIKKAYTKHVLRWDMRPRGITSIFNRIRDYGWRFTGFRDDCMSVENKMTQLRSTGMRWQDNNEDFVVEVNKLRDHINDALETCREMYPFITIDMKIIPCHRELMGGRRQWHGDRRMFPDHLLEDIENPTDYILALYMYMKKPIMTVHVLKGNSTINKYDVPMEDIVIASGTYLFPIISRNWGRDVYHDDVVSNRGPAFFLDVSYLSKMNLNRHPYISEPTDLYAWKINKSNVSSGNVCLGNMRSELRSTFLNAQFEAHITYLITWLTNYYIPQTNPINHVSILKNTGQNMSFEAFSNQGEANVFSRNEFRLHECSLPDQIWKAVYDYGRGGRNFRYNRFEIFSRDSFEYRNRKAEYLNLIKTKDLPCTECIADGNCEIQTNILLLLSEKAYSPLEEAYIGMYIEIAEYNVIIYGHKPIHFVEEVIVSAGFLKPELHYDRLIKVHTCCVRWAEANKEALILTGERYRNRVSMIIGNCTDHYIDILYQHAIQKTEFVWTRDNIDKCKNIAEPPKIDEDLPDAINTWLDNVDTSVERVENDVSEDLTPEQRTLLWATQLGGANNL